MVPNKYPTYSKYLQNVDAANYIPLENKSPAPSEKKESLCARVRGGKPVFPFHSCLLPRKTN